VAWQGELVDKTEARAILGVRAADGLDRARQAYRDLTKALHPDVLTHLPAEQLAVATANMARINQAWAVLQGEASSQPADPADRAGGVDGGRGQSAEWQYGPRPPGKFECVVCGSVPAARVRLRQVQSWLVWMRTRQLDAEACRACGQALYAQFQTRTLAAGWWGIGGPYSLLAVLLNYRQARKVRRFTRAAFRDPSITSLSAEPAPPVRPPSRRPLVWLSPIGAAFVAAAVVAGALDPNTTQPTQAPSSFLGTCWSSASTNNYSRRVDCSSTEAQWRVVSIQPTAGQCAGPAVSIQDQYGCLAWN
jgi:hypothetical protein